MKRLCLALLVSLFAATASAQVPIDGDIVGIEGNRIGVRDQAGKIFQVDITNTWIGADGKTYTTPATPSVIVSGTEAPKNLRVGQALQFTATMAGKRTVIGEVTAATLISLSPQSQTGILNADPVEEPAAAEGDRKKPGNLENCLVVGTITKIKSGAVTLAAPNLKPVIFRFAENAIITVSTNDLSVVRIGDKIKATGMVVALPLMVTQEVKIEHSPAVDDRPQRSRPKPEDVGMKKGQKPGERENPFALGDNEPAVAAKPKVKLELIKTN